MGTQRLDDEDPFRLDFSAPVLARGRWNGRPSLILDQTAFYPESGGRLADRKTLAAAAVDDVQVGDDGSAQHLVAADAAWSDVGSEVTGHIERARRRVHMSLHTAQHLLSRALADVASADTVSARRGETACTIDIDRDPVEEGRLARAEDLVSSVAGKVTDEPDLVALHALRVEDGMQVLVARGPSSCFDCGGFLKRVAAEAGGRGGGTRERAEGRLPAAVDWSALAHRALPKELA